MSARKENRNEMAWDELDGSLDGPHRGAMEEQLEGLKEQLLFPLLSSIENAALIHELRWAANEAAALAWFTICPMLVLPELLKEKVSAALQRWELQQLLWRRHAPACAAKEEMTPTARYLKPVVLAA